MGSRPCSSSASSAPPKVVLLSRVDRRNLEIKSGGFTAAGLPYGREIIDQCCTSALAVARLRKTCHCGLYQRRKCWDSLMSPWDAYGQIIAQAVSFELIRP
jgi:hypothetical protein